MPLMPGTRLGTCEILAPLGAGGMGEVYRARDTALGREVAIKVLTAEFAADPERLRRFTREAQATAALNHPNILAIFHVGSQDGVPFIVSELLEGETVRERLEAGVLPVRKAVEYAVQVAGGLASAHDKGIVHRDLKPENIFITADGRVKILDFGLAKLLRPEGGTAEDRKTVTAGTDAGMVLGTVGYMSPEQVRAQAVDARTDIFSLGAILYEMVSGKRAFRGETPADTMSAISRPTGSWCSSARWVRPAVLMARSTYAGRMARPQSGSIPDARWTSPVTASGCWPFRLPRRNSGCCPSASAPCRRCAARSTDTRTRNCLTTDASFQSRWSAGTIRECTCSGRARRPARSHPRASWRVR